MKILIIENEIYLSHSIAKSLMDIGHVCTMCVSPKDVVLENSYDVILVSTFVAQDEFASIAKRYPNAIVILLVSSLGNESKCILDGYGAKDYVLKPFMMEQLVEKIEHYISYALLEIKCNSYERYLSYQFEELQDEIEERIKSEFPIFINTNNTKLIDAYVYEYIKNNDSDLSCISLSQRDAIDEIRSTPYDTFIYITDFEKLQQKEKEDFFDAIEQKKVLIAHTSGENLSGYNVVELPKADNIFDYDSILKIEEYVKYIISNFQDKFSDTELSKKLGISRKSVWEKRKRYEIAR